MTLASGTRLGSYEVVAPIGAGGMGEVYRARDTKLGREVAIKVLPANFVNDPERLSRLQREARMLAALNHANIATIYGLEQCDGVSCLVMELVPGETLAERVKAGPLGIEEALKIAVQIAEALEAAHEKGIIHRDLKPANVKVTPEVKVKVLDFGLAKAFAGEATNEDIGNSPTLSMAATMQGVILGTAAYMSPEQAKGKAVTKATDIWGFGCVLYELLSGHPAFEGDDITEILAAVVRAEPNWNRLQENTPQSIHKLLRRCLRKDRRQRFQDATDVRIEIEDALTSPATTSVTGAEPLPNSTRTQKLWFAITAIFFLTTIVLASVLIYDHRSPSESAAVRFFVSAPDKMSFESGIGAGATGYTGGSLSPNGRRLAFTAKDESGKVMLWVRALDSLVSQPLLGTDGAALPFWSPDSRTIGFFVLGKLKKIDVEGGPPQTLTEAPNARGGTWNRDGVIVFAPSNS